ncbi:Regulator of telomere elongation helicase 1 [Quaeritorhiza haematococci]|nr:Regulator of telomere elongation helicase 1 [Quaeritorhiza haematococci]
MAEQPEGHTYNIRGITVKFPYPAYDSQLALMEKLIKTLQTGQNSLIESPTGTGKTLCLLCATLAWREAYMARRQLEKLVTSGNVKIDGGNKTGDLGSEGGSSHAGGSVKAFGTVRIGTHGGSVSVSAQKFDVELMGQLDAAVSAFPQNERYDSEPPRIFYASRTHSQLTQAVAELRRTGYRPSIRVLGSREQMCINPDVSSLSAGAAQANLCRKKVSKKDCEFHMGIDAARRQKAFTEQVLDIEELVTFGQKHRACPYYLARENQSQADVIFLPYNYLIDPTSRKAQNIDVRNAILIFDEGHNLEGACGETSSFELTASDRANCRDEVAHCVQIASNFGSAGSEYTAAEFAILRDLLDQLEHELNALELSPTTRDLVRPGEFMLQLLGRLNITFENVDLLLSALDAAADLVVQGTAFGESHRYRRTTKLSLNMLTSALKIVFKNGYHSSSNGSRFADIWKKYKVYIREETPEGGGRGRLPSSSSGKKRTLSFWCFSAGVAMRDLVERGVRSVVLASGTLSPLDSFATEMGVPFPHRLENPHVIPPEQIFVGVVPSGPAGNRLNSSYEHRSSRSFVMDLGNTIANVARVVPDGLLVFFPSYGVMTDCLQQWRAPSQQPGAKNIWDRIKQCKEPMVEPKNKAEFGQAMDQYYSRIQDGTNVGAVFFAVCRGKASEGIDFSDAKGRAVIVCGIPYPAAKDPKVLLKKQYLDTMHSERAQHKQPTISGDEWYKQQAARAVNQAIGRVIRHRNDYGAILLCDERFGYAANTKQLPVWIRPHVRVYKNFGESLRNLAQFFKGMDERQRKSGSAPEVQQPSSDHYANFSSERSDGHTAILQHKVFQQPKPAKYDLGGSSHTLLNTRKSQKLKRNDGLMESLNEYYSSSSSSSTIAPLPPSTMQRQSSATAPASDPGFTNTARDNHHRGSQGGSGVTIHRKRPLDHGSDGAIPISGSGNSESGSKIGRLKREITFPGGGGIGGLPRIREGGGFRSDDSGSAAASSSSKPASRHPHPDGQLQTHKPGSLQLEGNGKQFTSSQKRISGSTTAGNDDKEKMVDKNKRVKITDGDAASVRSASSQRPRPAFEVYVMKVKQTLTESEYETFKSLLRKHKANKIDIRQLIKELKSLFGCTDTPQQNSQGSASKPNTTEQYHSDFPSSEVDVGGLGSMRSSSPSRGAGGVGQGRGGVKYELLLGFRNCLHESLRKLFDELVQR